MGSEDTQISVQQPATQERPVTPGKNGGTLTPWVPGMSGNPGGRPSRKPITEAYARLGAMTNDQLAKVDKRTLTTFERIALAQVQKARRGMIASTKEISDRVEGRVPLSIQHSGNIGNIVDGDELEARVRELLMKASDGLPPAGSE